MLVTLQDFTVLPTDIFRRCVIESSTVKYLPTILPTEYSRRNTFCRWFHIPSLYRSEIQKKLLPTDRARQKKKKFPAWNIPTEYFPSVLWKYRRTRSVSKSVGDILYRPDISVGKVIGKFIPTEYVRRWRCRWWWQTLSNADGVIPSVNPCVIFFLIVFLII